MTQLSNIFPSFILPAWTTVTAAYSAVNGNFLLVNTTSGSITVTLPAAPASGATINFCDPLNTWATNNLIVANNGYNINGSSTALTADTSTNFYLVFVGGTVGWKFFNNTSSVPGQPGPQGIAGNTTIPTSPTVGDIPVFSATSGTLVDSGVAASTVTTLGTTVANLGTNVTTLTNNAAFNFCAGIAF